MKDAMEVVGPRKPALALPLPLPRPSIVDRQRTGGLFASIVKCVGQQKPAPRTLVLAWMQARWSCILSIPGGALLSYVRLPELACWSWL